jgi:hypothetical protein
MQNLVVNLNSQLKHKDRVIQKQITMRESAEEKKLVTEG